MLSVLIYFMEEASLRSDAQSLNLKISSKESFCATSLIVSMGVLSAQYLYNILKYKNFLHKYTYKLLLQLVRKQIQYLYYLNERYIQSPYFISCRINIINNIESAL